MTQPTLTQKADIGIIGLAVMGENLVLNIASKGFTVACFNRTVEKVTAFKQARGTSEKILGATSLEEFVQSLAAPRRVMQIGRAHV